MSVSTVWFWVCIGLCVFDVFMVFITNAMPPLRGYTGLFLLCGALTAVGALAHYINCKAEDKGSGK